MAHSADGDDDVDEKFNNIVANYGDTPHLPPVPKPGTQSPGDAHHRKGPTGNSGSPAKPTSNRLPDAEARRRHPAGQQLPDDEDFVPPTPPPLSAPSQKAWLTWIPALGGTVVLLFMALFWRSAPSYAITAAVLAALLGFGNFVRSLRTEPRDDDGAQV